MPRPSVRTSTSRVYRHTIKRQREAALISPRCKSLDSPILATAPSSCCPVRMIGSKPWRRKRWRE